MKGGSLKDRIKDGRLYKGSEAERQERLLHIAIQFAQGLAYAHEKGLIHQDVKPDNVLLSENMEVKVADFGLSGAKAVLAEEEAGNNHDGTIRTDGNAAVSYAKGMQDFGADEAAVSRNALGLTVLKGSGGYTPAYCSPEQESGSILSRKTDIYSWAASVLEMYLGKRPWKHGPEAGKDCKALCSDTRVAMPEELQKLLIRCLEEKEIKRPDDFAEIRQELLATYRKSCGKDYTEEDGTAASDSADSLNNQAVSYMELGMEERAMLCWREAQKADPSHAEVLYNRSLIDWREGVLTGREARMRLLSHPYYYLTEEGKASVTALAHEAGKESFDAPLFTDEPKHRIDLEENGLKRFNRKYFWHGQFYIIQANRKDPETDKDEGPLLYIFNAETGELTQKETFSALVQTGKQIRNASLSQDCRLAFFTTQDHFLVSYDRETKSIRHTTELKTSPNSMYDTPSPFYPVGPAGRFVWRQVSHGMGHGTPPSVEVYDMETGECLEIRNVAQQTDLYSERQMIRAGEDGALGDPDGELYSRSLSDGYRVVPVSRKGKELFRCDLDGRPVARISDAIVKKVNGRSGDFRYNVLRLTPDGQVWLTGDEGLMNFDIASGKCLRSFPFDMQREKGVEYLIDEDGLSVLKVDWEDEEKQMVWQYIRLPALGKEDQAGWMMARLESYQEYKDRLESLYSVQEAFENAQTDEELCRIYTEAEKIRRFYGSPVHRRMIKRLSVSCRQKDGFAYEVADYKLLPKEVENASLLAPFGIGYPEMGDALKEAIKKTVWLQNPYDVPITPDGKRALLLGSNTKVKKKVALGPWSSQEVEETVKAPYGGGLYLLDVATAGLFYIGHYEIDGKLAFCNDRSHIVFEKKIMRPNSRFYDLKLGCVELVTSDAKVAFERKEKAAHELNLVGETGEDGPGAIGRSLLWKYGIFTFVSEEDCAAFLDQSGGTFFVEDADETHGLIAYSEQISYGENIFKVWSTDERRNLLELPSNVSVARFSRSEQDGIRLLAAFDDIFHKRFSGQAHLKIFEFSFGYEPLAKRRFDVEVPQEWPSIPFPECEWEEAPSAEELAAGYTGTFDKSWKTIDIGLGCNESDMIVEAARLSKFKTAEGLYKAHEMYCEMAERFKARGHGQSRVEAEGRLLKAFQELEEKRAADELRKYYEIYRGLTEKHPDKEYYRRIRDFVQTNLDAVISKGGNEKTGTDAASSRGEKCGKKANGRDRMADRPGKKKRGFFLFGRKK